MKKQLPTPEQQRMLTPDEIEGFKQEFLQRIQPYMKRLQWIHQHKVPTYIVRKEADGSITFSPAPKTDEMKEIEKAMEEIANEYNNFPPIKSQDTSNKRPQ